MDTWADSPHLLTEIYQYERWCSHTSRIPIASTRCFTPKISKAHVSSGWLTGLQAQKLVPQRPLNVGLFEKCWKLLSEFPYLQSGDMIMIMASISQRRLGVNVRGSRTQIWSTGVSTRLGGC